MTMFDFSRSSCMQRQQKEIFGRKTRFFTIFLHLFDAEKHKITLSGLIFVGVGA